MPTILVKEMARAEAYDVIERVGNPRTSVPAPRKDAPLSGKRDLFENHSKDGLTSENFVIFKSSASEPQGEGLPTACLFAEMPLPPHQIGGSCTMSETFELLRQLLRSSPYPCEIRRFGVVQDPYLRILLLVDLYRHAAKSPVAARDVSNKQRFFRG